MIELSVKTILLLTFISGIFCLEDNHYNFNEEEYLSNYKIDEATLNKLFAQQYQAVPQAKVQPVIPQYSVVLEQHKIVQPVHIPVQKIIATPTTPPQYEYGYSVQDPHTGDVKTQHEVRKGDTVHGSYSIVDSDGTRRIVEYTADAQHGFNAVVKKEPANVQVEKPIIINKPHNVGYNQALGLGKYTSQSQSSQYSYQSQHGHQHIYH